MTSRSKSVHRKLHLAQIQSSDRDLFSGEGSPLKSDSQLPIKNMDLLYKRPSYRYTKSSKSKFVQQKINQIQKVYNIPESFTHTNLRIKQKLKDKSVGRIESMNSEQKIYDFSSKIRPITPRKESYQRVLKELQVTKDKSFFNTHSLENTQNDNLEELFYQQVKFLQKCKQIARNAK